MPTTMEVMKFNHRLIMCLCIIEKRNNNNNQQKPFTPQIINM